MREQEKKLMDIAGGNPSIFQKKPGNLEKKKNKH